MPRGAKAGNLNAAGPKGRALAFWQRRALRPADAWVRSLVAEYTDERLADLGGPECVSQGQRSLVLTAAIAHAVVALIFNASKEAGGLLNKDENGALALTPAARELPKFLGRIQAAEVSLGIAPRTAKGDADAFALMRGAIPVEARRVDA
jgi:hypothetical protein